MYILYTSIYTVMITSSREESSNETSDDSRPLDYTGPVGSRETIQMPLENWKFRGENRENRRQHR
jgi:hypothetical protein